MAANVRVAQVKGFTTATLSAVAMVSAVTLGAVAVNTAKPVAALSAPVTFGGTAQAFTKDAVVNRSISELHTFTNWLAANSANGLIGEVGIMNQNDSTYQSNWNNLMTAYLAECDRLGIATTQWAGGRVFSSTDPQAVLYSTTGAASADTEATNSPPLKAFAGSPVLHGLNMSGGEFNGANGTTSGATLVNGTLYSNFNPGVNGTDYGYPVAADWTKLAGMGIKTVRLPFSWERLQPTLNAALDSTALSALQAVVAAAGSAGINIILDCHNYAQYYSGTSTTVRTILFLGGSSATLQPSHLTDLWTRINTAFSGYGNVVAYDLMNEPAVQDNSGTYSNTAQAVSNWKSASQTVLSALRTAGVTKTIVVSGWWGAPPSTWVSKHGSSGWITDSANNFFYTSHQYFDEASTFPGSGTYNNGATYNYSTELALANSQNLTAWTTPLSSPVTLSVGVLNTSSAAATLTSPVSLVSAISNAAVSAANLVSPVSITSAAVRNQPAAAALISPVTIVSAAVRTQPAAAALTSPVTIAAGVFATTAAASTLSAPVTLLAGFNTAQAAAANLVSPVAITSAILVAEKPVAALNSPVSMVVAGTLSQAASVALTAPVTLSAGAVRGVVAAAALVSPVTVAAVAARVQAVTTSLTSPVTIAGTGLFSNQAVGAVLTSPVTIGITLSQSGTPRVRIASLRGFTAAIISGAALNSPVGLSASTFSARPIGATLVSPVALTATFVKAPSYIRIASVIARTNAGLGAATLHSPVTMGVSANYSSVLGAQLRSPVTFSAIFSLASIRVASVHGWAIQSQKTRVNGAWYDTPYTNLSSPVTLTAVAPTTQILFGASLTSPVVLGVTASKTIAGVANLVSPVALGVAVKVTEPISAPTLSSPVVMGGISLTNAPTLGANLVSPVTIQSPFTISVYGTAQLVSPVTMGIGTISGATSPGVVLQSPVTLGSAINAANLHPTASLGSAVTMLVGANRVGPLGASLASPVALVIGIGSIVPLTGAPLGSPVTLTAGIILTQLAAALLSSPVALSGGFTSTIPVTIISMPGQSTFSVGVYDPQEVTAEVALNGGSDMKVGLVLHFQLTHGSWTEFKGAPLIPVGVTD